MVEVRIEKLQRAGSKVKSDGKDLHISGEPGIGKTSFLRHLQNRLEVNYKIVKKTVRAHHEPADLARDLLHTTRREATERDSKSNQLISASAGITPISGGGTVDDRVRDIHKLEDLTKDWSGQPLLICIDDIHKVAEEDDQVRGIIGELSSVLGEGVQLISAGQISVTGISEIDQIHLNVFTLDQTQRFLNSEFGGLTDDKIRTVHSAVEGHPLYLDCLSESSEEEEDFELPESEVHETIRQRYIESLPIETEEFLREVAVLPELEERNVSAIIEGMTPAEVNQQLRSLNRRAIVQEVNQTDKGNRLYKIHERFRNYLLSKHYDREETHRTALDYHFDEIIEVLDQNDEDAIEHSLPHLFNAKYHFGEIYNDPTPKAFHQELNNLDIDYPERLILVFYVGFSTFASDLVELCRLEKDLTKDWVLQQVENQPLAELLVQIIDWVISQFEEDPLELSEIQVEASIDELPVESEPFTDVEMREDQAEGLERSLVHMFSYFSIEEPYKSEEHRIHVEKQIEQHDISLRVLKEFYTCMKSVLFGGGFEDEVEDIIEQEIEALEEELAGSLNSSIDFYEIRTQSLELGRDLFDQVHRETLLEPGVMEDLALEGGEVLEKAKNPAFALIWYSGFISYFREFSENDSCLDELTSRFDKMLSKRRMYEEKLDEPMITAKDTLEHTDVTDET